MVPMTAAERLARRYPQPRRNRFWIPLAIGFALLTAAWLAWAGGYGATGTVTARVDAFVVRSDTQIDVTVSVDRPDPSKAAECLLFAQAVTYDRVGETKVRIDAGGSKLTTTTVELRTFKRATTADLEGCKVIG